MPCGWPHRLPRFGPLSVLRRQRDVFDDTRFARLGSISVGHLYNLRNSAGYRAQRVVLTKTRPTRSVPIGVRKAPAPGGRQSFNCARVLLAGIETTHMIRKEQFDRSEAQASSAASQFYSLAF